MIRFIKFQTIHWDGTITSDPNFRFVARHPEYTLQTGENGFGSSWALYKDSRFVRSFKTLKAAREYLTDLLENPKK